MGQEIKKQIGILDKKNKQHQSRIVQITQDLESIENQMGPLDEKHRKLLVLAQSYKVNLNPHSKQSNNKTRYLKLKKEVDQKLDFLEKLKHGNQVKEEIFRNELDSLRKQITKRNDEINGKELEIFKLSNDVRDRMSRDQISSRNLREACENLKIPYTPPNRLNFDQESVTSAPPNKSSQKPNFKAPTFQSNKKGTQSQKPFKMEPNQESLDNQQDLVKKAVDTDQANESFEIKDEMPIATKEPANEGEQRLAAQKPGEKTSPERGIGQQQAQTVDILKPSFGIKKKNENKPNFALSLDKSDARESKPVA